MDGETANLAYEKTMERLLSPDATEEQFRNELARADAGAAVRPGMVLARAELAPGAPCYKGGVTRAATGGTSCAAAAWTAWSPTRTCC